MAEQGLGVDDAFAVLVRQARDTNTRLADLALALLASRRYPRQPEARPHLRGAGLLG